MTDTLQTPDYRDVDYRDIPTPWEPQPIVWRRPPGNSFVRNKEGLLAVIADPSQTHVVREVEVMTLPQPTKLEDLKHYGNITVDETLEGLVRVDEQFRQLEELTEIRVASTEWFPFSDETGRTRTLAKVEIIDGAHPVFRGLTDQAHVSDEENLPQKLLQESLRVYFANYRGFPLQDIRNFTNYIFGRPRLDARSEVGNKALYLVDIEPMLTFDIGARRH